MKKYEITADVDYISGHIRYGHLALTLDESELKLFKALSDEDQLDYLDSQGDLIIDEYEVDDFGQLEKMEITEIK